MQSTVIVALCLIALTTCDAFMGFPRPMLHRGIGRLGMGRFHGGYGGGYGDGYDGYDGYDNGYGRMGGRGRYDGYGNDNYGDYGRDSPDFGDYGIHTFTCIFCFAEAKSFQLKDIAIRFAGFGP